MKKALYDGDIVDAEAYTTANLPPPGLKCPACKNDVYWVPKTLRAAFFAHCVRRGSCVNPDGFISPRSGRTSVRQASKHLVFRPDAPPTRRRFRSTAIGDEIGRSGGDGSGTGGIKRVKIRNAADAAHQERLIRAYADPDGARDGVEIDIEGHVFPWSAFYFTSHRLTEIYALHAQHRLPPYIALEVMRNASPKKIQSASRIACTDNYDALHQLNFESVIVNVADVPPNTFDLPCVVIGSPEVSEPNGYTKRFIKIEVTMSRPDFVAPAPPRLQHVG